MTEVQQLHREAMDLAEEADLLKLRGQPDDSTDRLRRAYAKERQAALSLEARPDFEPTRSILFRSAASLALECGEHEDVDYLVRLGLQGDPPEEIAGELTALRKRIAQGKGRSGRRAASLPLHAHPRRS